MKHSKRLIVTGAIAAVSALALAGCSSSGSDDSTDSASGELTPVTL